MIPRCLSAFRGRLRRRSLLAGLIVTAPLLALAPTPAYAQQTRTEETAQQQAEKNTRLVPNRASFAERTLDWLEDHFTDPTTVHLTFRGIYPSAGFAPEIGDRHAVASARLGTGVARSMKGDTHAYGSLAFSELAGDKLEIETGVRWVDAT